MLATKSMKDGFMYCGNEFHHFFQSNHSLTFCRHFLRRIFRKRYIIFAIPRRSTGAECFRGFTSLPFSIEPKIIRRKSPESVPKNRMTKRIRQKNGINAR